MTAPALMNAAAPPEIATRWATPVWIGQLQPDVDTTSLHDRLASAEGGCQDLQPAQVVDEDQAAATFTRLAAGISPGTGPYVVRLQLQLWGPGHRVPLACAPGQWQAWCYLATAGEGAHPNSGAVCLHDPRAGCDAATVPGLPWGRAVTIAAHPGLAVVAPSWLSSSVLPVSTGHRAAVLIATGTAKDA